jgi:hypothetical protein
MFQRYDKLVSGYHDFSIYRYWLMISTPLKNMKISWDDDIPNIWKNENHVANHQPVLMLPKNQR